jgi:hypothetical protein
LLGAVSQTTPAVTSSAAPVEMPSVAIRAELRAASICALPVALQTL